MGTCMRKYVMECSTCDPQWEVAELSSTNVFSSVHTFSMSSQAECPHEVLTSAQKARLLRDAAMSLGQTEASNASERHERARLLQASLSLYQEARVFETCQSATSVDALEQLGCDEASVVALL